MKKRDRIRHQELEHLENEFRPLLASCLEQCAKGHWGAERSYWSCWTKMDCLATSRSA